MVIILPRMGDAVRVAAAPGEGADATRTRLVAAAAEVFSERGYDKAGVQEIARRAGLTTGAIYGRFDGKAELLLAAIEAHSRSEFDALFADHRFDGRATDLLATVGSHLVTRDHERGQALLLEAFVAARRDPEVAALVRDVLDDRAARLAELVAAAKASGAIDPDLDTQAVVRFCHAVGLGFLLFEAADLSQPEAAPWEALISRLVNAIAPATPTPTTR
jgi:AcrR family transcriptional regulator